MSTTNTNIETGIRFGTIYGNDAPNLMEAIFENGTDESYKAWREDLLKQIKSLLDDGDQDALASFIRENSHEDDADETAATMLADQGDEPATDADADGVFDTLNLGDEYQNDEPAYSYVDSDGNTFQMSSLGGASLIWCIKTDNIVHAKRLCSPCVPNAADLQSGLVDASEGYECYGVPTRYE